MKSKEELAERYCDKVSLGYLATEDEILETFLAGYDAGQPKWISVEIRFPKNEGFILIKEPSRCPRVVRSYSVDGVDYVGGSSTLTHWVPLPPKPGEK